MSNNKVAKEDLSDEELEFYSRQLVLSEIGYEGQLKLAEAKVCVVGLGGLGCPIATQLTAMGVGHLRLVDRDIVERSNLQRQHLYDINSLWYPKVEVAAEKLKSLNPHVEIESIPLSINEYNAKDIIEGVDLVIDGLDALTPRYAINRACVRLKIPYIFGSAIMTVGNISTIVPGETACLECFYGGLDDERMPTCAVVGVHPSMLGIVASIEVSEAIRILMDEKPYLKNTLLYIDIGDLTFRKISVFHNEGCPVCGLKSTGPPKPLRRELIEELCGRDGKRVYIVNPKNDLEISIKDLYKLLKRRGVNVKAKANLGITFDYDDKVTMSILISGVMITQGIKDKEEAIKIYHGVVTDGLGVSRHQIV